MVGEAVDAGASPGWVVLVAAEVLVVAAAWSSPPAACWAGTPVWASAPGMPRPGVGSNGTHPTPANHTSGQAWAWRPWTV